VNALRHAIQARFGERVTSADVVVVAKRLMRPNDGPSNLPRPPEKPVQPVPTSQEPSAPPADPPHVTIGDLVAAGLLPEGASIEALVKGVPHVARVAQGRIELEGQVYDSPSAASKAIRKVESWNGWIDWKYKGETLSDLRRRLPPTAGAARPTAG
jgi:hypothetical protein